MFGATFYKGWFIMSILLFFNDTKKLVIHESTENIFDRGLVNVLLEPYQELEGINYTYDDISTMIINEFYYPELNEDINDEVLPKGLKKLEIRRSYLNVLPEFPPSIEKIIIGSSEIHLNEAHFTKYPNLKQLELTVLSFINPSVPTNCYKKITLKHEYNDYGTLTMNLIYEGRADFDTHINLDDTRYYRDYRDGRLFEYNPPVIALPDANKLAHLVNNGQSVHISSINKAICKSIALINELAEKHPPVENPLNYIIRPKNVLKRAYHYIFSMFSNDITESNQEIQNWFFSREIHSMHQITFAQLFEKVVRIIIHHEHKEGLIERLREELKESMGLCFTGRMNRLVNSLSGIVEGIKVSFSIEEQIQLESQQIIKRLNEKAITIEKAKEEMVEIFNDEDIASDPQLIRLKEDYVNALDEFVDDNL